MDDDEYTAGDGGPFHVDHLTWDGGVINKPYSGFFSPYFINYTADYVRARFSDLTSHLSTIAPSGFDVATRVAAKTSPSRPYDDLGQDIGELREFPELFRVVAAGLHNKFRVVQTVAQANLLYQFGWAPLISDLVNLYRFQTEFDKRVKEVERLRKRGLRRTIQIGTYQNVVEDIVFAQSLFRFIAVPYTKVTTEEVWGYIVWSPDADLPPTSSPEMRALLRNTITGLKIDPYLLWELLPYSWLTDWCTNASEFMLANRNMVPATHGPVQVMRRKTTSFTSKGYDDPSDNLTMTPIHCTSVSKGRSIYSPAFTAQLPFLDERKMSILGSIGLLSHSNSTRTYGL